MTEKLNSDDFVKFMLGSHRRLNNIIRFNTRIKTYPEPVSAHSFFVTLYSYIFGCHLKKKCKLKVDIEKLLKYALFHDLEECISGDILTPFKKKFRKEYNSLSKLSIEQVTEGLPSDIRKDIIKSWKMSKSGIEGDIVDFCDNLSGYIYCAEQIKTGNRYFEDIITDYESRLMGSSINELADIALIIIDRI